MPQEVSYAYVISEEEKLPDASRVGDAYLASLVHEGTATFRLPVCQHRSLYPGQIW